MEEAGKLVHDGSFIIQPDLGDITEENTDKGTQPKKSSGLKHIFLLSKGQDVNNCKKYVRKCEHDYVSL